MSYRLIDIILKDEKKTDEEKKKIIGRLLKTKEEIDRLAKEKDISVFEAIESIAEEKNIDIEPIKYDTLREAVEKGVGWLKSEQHTNNGWGWDILQMFKYKIPENELKKSTLTTAWSTSVSILALNEWQKYSGDQDHLLKEIIKRGIEYLKKNCNQDSCWGPYPLDLPSFKENTNVFDTSISVLAILGIEKDVEFVSKAVEKLQSLQKENGGWAPSEEDEKNDVGATSLAIQALIKYNQTDKWWHPKKNIEKGIKWLIENQQDGGWSDGEKGSGVSFLTRTYDALEALVRYDPEFNGPRIKEAVEKGIEWLLDSIRFESEDEIGLAWRSDKIEMSDIENTATAIIALLDCGVDPTSLEIEEGIKWLLERQKEDGRWGSVGFDTPCVILCLIKFMEKMYGKR